MRFDSPTPGRTRRISPASSNSFKERLTVTELRDKAAASSMTVKRSLKELEDAGLILRVRRGVGEPNRIYTLLPKKEGCRDE